MVFGSATQMAVVPGSDQTPGASESSLHCVEESAGIRPLISNDECGWMELLQVDFIHSLSGPKNTYGFLTVLRLGPSPLCGIPFGARWFYFCCC